MNRKIEPICISENNEKMTSTKGWPQIMMIMICSVLACSAVWMPLSAWGLDPEQRKAFVTSLPQGEKFENDGTLYVWLPTLRAEKTDARHDKLNMASNEGSTPTPADMIERKGQFAVYSHLLLESPSILTATGSSGDRIQAYPVVLNLKTQSIGILTGHLWLKLKDMQDAQSIADSYQMTLSFVNTPMATAFYEVPENMDILKLRNQLASDSRVVRATLDMVDKIRLPR